MRVVLRGGLRLFVRLYGLIHFANSLDLYSSSFWTSKPKLYWSHLVCWPNCANISFGFELCLTGVVPLDSAQNSGLVELKNHRNWTSIEVYRPCFLFSMRKNKCSRGSAGDHSSNSASARGPIFFADFSAIYWKWSCIPWYLCYTLISWDHLDRNLEENMMVHTIDSYYLRWKRYSHSFALLSNKIRNTWPIACIVMGYEYLYDTVSGIPPSTLLTANISTNILIYFVLGIERDIS